MQLPFWMILLLLLEKYLLRYLLSTLMDRFLYPEFNYFSRTIVVFNDFLTHCPCFVSYIKEIGTYLFSKFSVSSFRSYHAYPLSGISYICFSITQLLVKKLSIILQTIAIHFLHFLHFLVYTDYHLPIF